uniref:Uncharacterized protein n=1 Tax=Anguilla anguilla TaxID=7936 RepID=A0A0E9QHQ5_ANGAN
MYLNVDWVRAESHGELRFEQIVRVSSFLP